MSLRAAGSIMSVDRSRVLDDRLDAHPPPAFQPLAKAAFAPGMTGDPARLFNGEQDRVVVAVEPHVADALHMPGCLALAPQTAARARPVVRFARRNGARQRIAIHPGERKDLAGLGVLRNRRDETVGRPSYL